jgi:hypothetical protein
MEELKQYLEKQDAKGLNDLVHSTKLRESLDLFFENGQAQYVDESNVLAFFHLLGAKYRNNGVGVLKDGIHVSAKFKEPGYFHHKQEKKEFAYIPITNTKQEGLYHCLERIL